MKSLLVSVFAAALLLLPVASVSAAEIIDPDLCKSTPNSTLCQDSNQTQGIKNNSLFGPDGVLTKAASLLAKIVGIVSVIMVIIGGLKYVLASGDPSNISSAKNTIMYALVGLAVAVVAQSIIVFVLNRLT